MRDVPLLSMVLAAVASAVTSGWLFSAGHSDTFEVVGLVLAGPLVVGIFMAMAIATGNKPGTCELRSTDIVDTVDGFSTTLHRPPGARARLAWVALATFVFFVTPPIPSLNVLELVGVSFVLFGILALATLVGLAILERYTPVRTVLTGNVLAYGEQRFHLLDPTRQVTLRGTDVVISDDARIIVRASPEASDALFRRLRSIAARPGQADEVPADLADITRGARRSPTRPERHG